MPHSVRKAILHALAWNCQPQATHGSSPKVGTDSPRMQVADPMLLALLSRQHLTNLNR